MSKVRWEDTSGYGHLQRVAGDGRFTRTQRAYRKYIGHTTSCPTCEVDSTQCVTAEELWSAYRAATAS